MIFNNNKLVSALIKDITENFNTIEQLTFKDSKGAFEIVINTGEAQVLASFNYHARCEDVVLLSDSGKTSISQTMSNCLSYFQKTKNGDFVKELLLK